MEWLPPGKRCTVCGACEILCELLEYLALHKPILSLTVRGGKKWKMKWKLTNVWGISPPPPTQGGDNLRWSMTIRIERPPLCRNFLDSEPRRSHSGGMVLLIEKTSNRDKKTDKRDLRNMKEGKESLHRLLVEYGAVTHKMARRPWGYQIDAGKMPTRDPLRVPMDGSSSSKKR